MTKLDVLDGLETVKVCVGYKDEEGNNLDHPPAGAEGFEAVTPVYEELPGWSESTFGVKRLEDLPENARNYLKFVEEQIGAPIDIISTGPERTETIILRHPFDN